jgi:hypothetical protein
MKSPDTSKEGCTLSLAKNFQLLQKIDQVQITRDTYLLWKEHSGVLGVFKFQKTPILSRGIEKCK